MSAQPPQIAAIFAADPVGGTQSGDGWAVDSVRRDVAVIHHLTSNAFSCSLDGVMEFDGRGFNAHFIFVRSGGLSVGQCGHHRTLSGGDIFVGCAWLPLTLEASDGLDALIITLPGWWALQRIMDQFQILPHLYVGKNYFAAPIISTLAQRLFDLNDSSDAVASQGLAMIADLMRTALAACVEEEKVLPRAQGRMGEILWFVARNLDKRGLSAQDAAASLKCSVRTIYKACATYKTSFSAVVTETRLVSAQYQLMRTNERVSEIAYGVGFASLSHFSRLFRARFGIPAKEMRNAKASQAPQ
jgi:AraC-like DNA-binding protein